MVSGRPCLSQPATEAAGPWQVYSGGGEYGDVHMDIVSICRSVAVQLVDLKQLTLKITYEDLRDYGNDELFPFKRSPTFFGANKLSNFYYVTELYKP